MEIEGITSSLVSSTADALARNLSKGREPPEERNAAKALCDLTLPESLTTSLALLFQELGYTLTGSEIRDRAGERRKFTLASRSETKLRHFLHIPNWILDDPNDPNPVLVSGLGLMLPKQLRVFVLSEGLDSPAEYWETVAEPSWHDSQVKATFVAWRRVTKDLTTKAREDQLKSIQTLFELDTNGAERPPASAPRNGPPEREEVAASKRPYLFISYSWDSEEHSQKVLQLANWLRESGAEAWIDQWETSPPRGWPLWMQDQVEKAKFVLCVCTEKYKRRVERKEPQSPDGQPAGRGVTWESMIITNELYDSTQGQDKFIPIVFSPEAVEHVPVFLRGYSVYNVATDEGRVDLYRAVTQQRLHVPPPLGDIVSPDQLEQPSELGPASW
jgi:hypothetical protein